MSIKFYNTITQDTNKYRTTNKFQNLFFNIIYKIQVPIKTILVAIDERTKLFLSLY